MTDDGTQAIIRFNKIAFYPAIVDQDGRVLYLEEQEISRQMLQMQQAIEQGAPMPSPLSANCTMDDSKKVVSSGIILDVSSFLVLEDLFPEAERVPATPSEQLVEENKGS